MTESARLQHGLVQCRAILRFATNSTCSVTHHLCQECRNQQTLPPTHLLPHLWQAELDD